MPIKINIDRELPEQFFNDVMVTMVESGNASIHYWADGDPEYWLSFNVQRREDLDVTSIQLAINPARMPVEHRDNVVVISPASVAIAIENIIQRGMIGKGYMDYLVRAVIEADAGDIDATIADCIAQVVAFDQVVYG